MNKDEYEVGTLEDAGKFAIIRMAREAGWTQEYLEFGDVRLERFAALVREDEREKQQRHRVTLACPICAGTLMDDEQPFASLAARQMRDAAVKVCRTEYDSCDKFGDVDGRSAAKSIAEAIAALPIPGEEK